MRLPIYNVPSGFWKILCVGLYAAGVMLFSIDKRAAWYLKVNPNNGELHHYPQEQG